MTSPPRTILWLRGDLRLDDNPALAAAVRRGKGGCTAIFIMTPEQWKQHHWGEHRCGMMVGALNALRLRLESRGVDLRVIQGSDDASLPVILSDVARTLEVSEIHANREFGVNEDRRDEHVRSAIEGDDIDFIRHEDQTILPVREIRSGGGTPYTVFTPFKKKWLALLEEVGIPEIATTGEATRNPHLASGKLLPREVEPSSELTPDSIFAPGEDEPLRRLETFLDGPILRYHEDRDPPALDGTSSLSPWLACGSISPRRILRRLVDAHGSIIDRWPQGPSTWLSELIWREFYRHVMDGIPRLSMNRPLHGWTDRVAWRNDEAGFQAWCEGQTGIGIVDAGMRQLAHTGWMHNRVRMIVAMFLTKNLLIDWRRGERFFMNQLVDGDFPSNNGGWQWAASTGTDAAPYFRIFNPDRQAERFDAEDEYIRRWVPEFGTPAAPPPMVDLKHTRVRAIEAFKTAKNQGQ